MTKRLLIITLLLIVTTNYLYPQEHGDKQKFNLGRSYEKNGDFKNASRLFLELFEATPSSGQYFDAVVRTMKAGGRHSELLAIVQPIATERPSVRLNTLMGELYWQTGDRDKAGEYWDKAIELAPNDKATYDSVAALQSSLMLFDRAVHTYVSGRLTIGDKMLFADELSRLYALTGNFDMGTIEVLKLFETTRSLPQAEGRLSALMVTEKGNREVTKVMEERFSNWNDNIYFLKLYSWFYRASENFDKALELYVKIDDLANAKGREILNFANEARRDGQFNIAVKAYQKLIDMGKGNRYFQTAQYGMTRTLESKLAEDELPTNDYILSVIKRYEEIIRAYPGKQTAADSHLRIARLATDYLNDVDLAEKHLKQLTKDFPKLNQGAQGMLQLGDIYVTKGELQEAQKLYSGFLKKYKKQYPAYSDIASFRLAELIYFDGEIDSAKVLFGELSSHTSSDIANDAIRRIILIEQNEGLIMALKLYAKSELHIKRKQYDSAASALLKCAKYSAGEDLQQNALLLAADVYMKNDSSHLIIPMMGDFIRDFPESIYLDKAILMLADAYYARGRLNEAYLQYADLVLKFPHSIYTEKARRMARLIRDKVKS